MSRSQAVATIVAVWLGLSLLLLAVLVLRAWRLGRLTHRVQPKEAPGGLQEQ